MGFLPEEGEWFRGPKLDGVAESRVNELDEDGDGRVDWLEFGDLIAQVGAPLVLDAADIDEQTVAPRGRARDEDEWLSAVPDLY